MCLLGTVFPLLTLNSLHLPGYTSQLPTAGHLQSLLILLRGFWNLCCSPQAWLLPVMVLYNWISWVFVELLYILTPLGLPPYRVLSHLPIASPSSSMFFSLMALLWEFSSWPGKNVLLWHSFGETFGVLQPLLQSPCMLVYPSLKLPPHTLKA